MSELSAENISALDIVGKNVSESIQVLAGILEMPIDNVEIFPGEISTIQAELEANKKSFYRLVVDFMGDGGACSLECEIKLEHKRMGKGYWFSYDVSKKIVSNGKAFGLGSIWGHFGAESDFEENFKTLLGQTFSAPLPHEYRTFEKSKLSDEPGAPSMGFFTATMCLARQAGKVMPPILAQDDEIRRAMHAGETAVVSALVNRITMQTPSASLRAHIELERALIMRIAQGEADFRNPEIGVLEKCDYAGLASIGEDPTKESYKILVIVNEPNGFDKEVVEKLKEDQRFGNTKVLIDYNLGRAMEMCSTGQIDFVLFDWREPSIEEAMQFGVSPFRVKPRQDDVVVPLNAEAPTAGHEIEYNEEGLAALASNSGMRQFWIDHIEQRCLAAEVAMPPSFIVTEQQFIDKGLLPHLHRVLEKEALSIVK